jgi:starch synthase (maltosyl-transferring)
MKQVRIVIENVTPSIDAGRFASKAVSGDRIEVAADIWKDGHELLKAVALWRKLGAEELRPGEGPAAPRLDAGWHEAPLSSSFESNDRWSGSFTIKELGTHVFTVLAWTDAFGSWRSELKKKVDAKQDVPLEILEGIDLVERTAAKAKGTGKKALEARLLALRGAAPSEQIDIALSEELAALMALHDLREEPQLFASELPLWIDRERARYGSWYEIFVRSQGSDPSRSATFREAEGRLPAIAAMGFDVVYLTPIHPIGHTARRGPNNSDFCGPSDPGSPWAIGSEAGGHTAIHPELGTIADFDHFVEVAAHHKLEIALDIAVQCSPDHPWVKEHPEWFSWRPDGTIKYAENPPKKYKDIYPINFDTADREGLYHGLLEVFRFWIGHGVKIFRVDNPHTKPVGFWEWLIASIHREHPEVLFLAEAFTRPKRMRYLAKLGFSQSYSYFTWRTTRAELEEYATELFLTEAREVMRPNFFANTPDILHEILQAGGRPAFITRLVLAATLSPTYGIYSGFELCERVPLRPGSEEYLHSEKFEVKAWDWERPGNITDTLVRINAARREQRALQLAGNLRFLESSNPHIIAYARMPPEKQGDLIVTVVNLDPFHLHEGTVRLPVDLYEADTYPVTDLLTDAVYQWRSEWNYVRLDPQALPAHVLVVGKP